MKRWIVVILLALAVAGGAVVAYLLVLRAPPLCDAETRRISFAELKQLIDGAPETVKEVRVQGASIRVERATGELSCTAGDAIGLLPLLERRAIPLRFVGGCPDDHETLAYDRFLLAVQNDEIAEVSLDERVGDRLRRVTVRVRTTDEPRCCVVPLSAHLRTLLVRHGVKLGEGL